MSGVKLSAIALFIISVVIFCLTFEVWAAAFLGVLFALSLNGPAEWIRSKWRMPSWTATLITMMMVLIVLTGLGFLIGPPLIAQADEMGRKLPAAMEKTLDWLDERKWGRDAVAKGESLSGMSAERLTGKDSEKDAAADAGAERRLSPESALPQYLATEYPMDGSERVALSTAPKLAATDQQVAPVPGNDVGENESSEAGAEEESEKEAESAGTDEARSLILPVFQTLAKMLSVTVWTTALVLVSFVVTLYVALNPDVYRRGVLWLIPVEHEAVATLTMTRMCTVLRWWMLGRLASMVAIGLLTSLGMWMIGMPAPLALGALAGLLSFVPNIGPILAGVPGVLLAFPNGFGMVLSALGVYVAAQIVESNLISPLVDQYTVTTPPAVLIVTQVIIGLLGGAWGILIATPLLVVVMVLTQQLYVREYIERPIKVIGTTDDDDDESDEKSQAESPRPTPLSPVNPVTSIAP